MANDEKLDTEFVSAEKLLEVAVLAFQKENDADRETAVHWLRVAAEVVLED